MGKFFLEKMVLGMVMGLSVLWFAPGTDAQQKHEPPGQQTNISDRELRAFVTAYVATQKIRLAYEPSLRNVQDPQESQKIQQQANSQIEKVLEEQGLNVGSYNKIFEIVNANNKLRKEALTLIDQERKRS